METFTQIENSQLIFNNKKIFVIIDDENNLWFKGVDIARLLEYQIPEKAIRQHVRSKCKKPLEEMHLADLAGFDKLHPKTIFINEPGLYALIMHSKMSLAEKFQEWIQDDVLPTIRKTGAYKIRKQVTQLFKDQINHLNKEYERSLALVDAQRNRINRIKSDVVVKTKDRMKCTELCLIWKNDIFEEYPLYILRCQKYNTDLRLNTLRIKFPNLEILQRFDNPNAINCYNRLKESGCIIYKGNNIKTNLTIYELVDKLTDIDNERFYV